MQNGLESYPNTPGAFMSESKDDNLFKAPHPHFAQHGRTGSMDSSASDLSRTVVDREEYRGHESTHDFGRALQQDISTDFSVTDMILFDGEQLEPPTAADEEISQSVRKEGKMRRALSRRKRKGISTESAEPLTSSRKGSLVPPSFSGQDELSGDEGANTTRSGQPHRNQPQASPHMYPPPAGRFDATARRGSAYSAFTHLMDDGDAYSRKGGHSGASTPYGRRSSTPGLPLLQDADLSSFDIDEADREDLNIIAELARGGRPNLDAIFDREIERSQGKVVVGCCGPTTLNNHVRSMVASRIDPGRVAKGDSRGNIELVAEEFSF